MFRNLIIIVILAVCTSAHADKINKPVAKEVFRVRLFFGLSIPDGNAISLNDWNEFLSKDIASAFDGFNVVDSTGFYKGRPERSKIVTIIVNEDEINKVKEIARKYAKKFKQDSVMMVKVPVYEWDFIKINEK